MEFSYRCLVCEMVNVFPGRCKDGYNCMRCKGALTPIGEAKVHKKPNTSITVDVNVDTEPLTEALELAKELEGVLARLSPHQK